jgi:hypothetical protein
MERTMAAAGHGVGDYVAPWSDGCVIQPGPTRLALARRDAVGLEFIAEMYGVQLDQLARLLGLTTRQVNALAAHWAERKLACCAVLSQGPPWVWPTRTGLQACGLRYPTAPPALPRLAHIRATAAVRLAMQAAPAYAEGGAHWRSERRLRSRLGRLGARDHLPDAEVHWPDAGAVAWAGECWAIEVELTAKTLRRTVAIMREVLARTGDYGCPAAEAVVPGTPPRHARAIYLCSPAAAGTVRRARAELGTLGGRVEIRELPAEAYLPPPDTRRGTAHVSLRTGP